ncbi:MAG: hypothetical protein LBL37_05605 [Gracilibacteraceae bacterium]|nr:hypothetical protein [Gracilibacteraceae bacterium]
MPDQLSIPSLPAARDPVTRVDGPLGSQGPNQAPNLSDTARVIRPSDREALQQKRPDAPLEFNFRSLSARTFRLLSDSETATQALRRILFSPEAAQLLKAGAAESAMLMQFLESFFLPPEELGAYLKANMENFSVFRGEFFDVLRQILAQNSHSPQIQDALANFLKGLELFQHRQNSAALVMHNLTNILPHLSADGQEVVRSALLTLGRALADESAVSGAMKDVMLVLRNAAGLHKDSPLRNMVMQAMHNLTRLESGGQTDLLRLYNTFSATVQQFGRLSPEQREFLQEALLAKLHTAAGSAAAEQVFSALDKGLSADNPLPIQLASSHTLSAILLNNSILLPLVYMFIPLKLGDTFLFSELWGQVENGSEGGDGSEAAERGARLFFTLQSSVFGYFQGTLQTKGQSLSVELEAPESALEAMAGLEDYLAPLTGAYGYELRTVSVTPLARQKKIFDVFDPRILKEAYLNVRV